MNKTFLKFLSGGVAIVLLAAGAIYALNYYRYRNSPEYQAQKYFEDLRKRYEEDTYGGDTPEETLRLFIDALKRGDVELASKYYLIENQQKEKIFLESIERNEKAFATWVDNLSHAKKNKEENAHAAFEYEVTVSTPIVDKQFPNLKISAGTYTNDITLIKGPHGLWKIENL